MIEEISHTASISSIVGSEEGVDLAGQMQIATPSGDIIERPYVQSESRSPDEITEMAVFASLVEVIAAINRTRIPIPGSEYPVVVNSDLLIHPKNGQSLRRIIQHYHPQIGYPRHLPDAIVDHPLTVIAGKVGDHLREYSEERKKIPDLINGKKDIRKSRSTGITTIEMLDNEMIEKLKSEFGDAKGYRRFLRLSQHLGGFFDLLEAFPSKPERSKDYNIDLLNLEIRTRQELIKFFRYGAEQGMSSDSVIGYFKALFETSGILSFISSFKTDWAITYFNGLFAELNAQLELIDRGYRIIEHSDKDSAEMDVLGIDVICEDREGNRYGVQIKGSQTIPAYKLRIDTSKDSLDARGHYSFVRECKGRKLMPMWIDICSDCRAYNVESPLHRHVLN